MARHLPQRGDRLLDRCLHDARIGVRTHQHLATEALHREGSPYRRLPAVNEERNALGPADLEVQMVWGGGGQQRGPL